MSGAGGPDGTALLGVRDLVLRAGARELARAVAFEVREGELWCVVGRNGCGKSTLLATLAGLRRAHAGSIAIAGRALPQWSPREAARIRAWLPQSLHDAFPATVLDTVLAGRHPHLGRWDSEDEEDRSRAIAELEALDGRALADRDVLTLSGGERQRVALATVLLQDARVLLLDEPTAHLDPGHRVAVLARLREYARARPAGIVLATHDLDLAWHCASHVLIMLPDGSVRAGTAATTLNEAALSLAFDHPVRRLGTGDATTMVPVW